MSSKPHIILHIVYIHGFQGDHTTFQAFPTDLHHALQPTIPPHIELRSILYPTYKSKRPIAEATQKFLQWLKTLPAGPVILCAHSMGGLLAAEAATSPYHIVSKRVMAMIACDVPFLGMHPHVVVSGIASLLPHKQREKEGHGVNGGGSGLKTEKEMNDLRHVSIASAAESRSPSPNVSQVSLPGPDSSAPPSLSSGPFLAPPPLPPRPSSTPPTIQTRPNEGQLSLSHQGHSSALMSRTLDFIESHSNDRVGHFISKHRSDPITAATRWVVESLEFGICMFDPKGLRRRYTALERWQGDWISFWTVTAPRDSEGRETQVTSNGDGEWDLGMERGDTTSGGSILDVAAAADSLSQFSSLSRSSASSLGVSVDAPVSRPMTKSEEKAIKKQAKADQKMHDKELKSLAKVDRNHCKTDFKTLKKQLNTQSPHHFVFRPSSTQRWEQVKIHGAKDEVEAHCGLFLRDTNLEYEVFVRRVAEVTRGWIVKLN